MKKILVFLAALIGLSTVAHAQNGMTVSLNDGVEKVLNVPQNYVVLYPFKDVKTKTYYVVIKEKDVFDYNKFKIYSGPAGKELSEIKNDHATITADDFVFLTPLGEMKFTRPKGTPAKITNGSIIIDLERFP